MTLDKNHVGPYAYRLQEQPYPNGVWTSPIPSTRHPVPDRPAACLVRPKRPKRPPLPNTPCPPLSSRRAVGRSGRCAPPPLPLPLLRRGSAGRTERRRQCAGTPSPSRTVRPPAGRSASPDCSQVSSDEVISTAGSPVRLGGDRCVCGYSGTTGRCR